MEVTVKNYQELAKRTLVDLGSQAVNGVHMALGVVSELGELEDAVLALDYINMKEEHGDVLYYVANICNIYGLSFSCIVLAAFDLPNIDRDVFKLHDFVDVFKRELAYSHTVETAKLENYLILLLEDLIKTNKKYGFTLQVSLTTNIRKLAQRYPDEFTESDALNRDLEAERAILEE